MTCNQLNVVYNGVGRLKFLGGQVVKENSMALYAVKTACHENMLFSGSCKAYLYTKTYFR